MHNLQVDVDLNYIFHSFRVHDNTLRKEIFSVTALLYEHTDPFIHRWLDIDRSHVCSDYCGLGQGELQNLNSRSLA